MMPVFAVNILRRTERGVHCHAAHTDTGDGASFWLPVERCMWSVGDPRPGQRGVEVAMPKWLASKHRQLVGDAEFEQAKLERRPTMAENGKKDYGPSIMIARLYQKKSASGQVYFTGRMGPAKLVMLRAKEPAEDGTPIWNVLVQEAQQRQSADTARDVQAAKRDWQAPPATRGGFDKQLDDEIPF